MTGQVLDYSFQTNSGDVAGDDGGRYSFTGADWQGSGFPETGMRVDFTPDGNAATAVNPDAAPTGVSSDPVPSRDPAPSPATSQFPGRSPDAPRYSGQTGPSPGTDAVPSDRSIESPEPALAGPKASGRGLFTRGMGMARSIPTLYFIIGGSVAGVVVVAIVALIALSATGIIGGGNPQPASALDLTPDDVTTVIRLDVQKILAEEDLAEDMDIDDFVDLDDVGILAEEVSEIVTADGGSGGSLIILKGDFNVDDLKEAWEDDGAEEDAYRGYEVWTLSGGTIAAPLKGYLVTSDWEEPVEGALKNLYNGAGSLEQADQDNAMKRILDRLGRGYVVYAAGARACRVDDCEAYGYVLAEYDQEEEEAKREIALLFRNERSAQRAADDYDEVADFLEYEAGIDIEDTESDGDFVVGIAWQELD